MVSMRTLLAGLALFTPFIQATTSSFSTTSVAKTSIHKTTTSTSKTTSITRASSSKKTSSTSSTTTTASPLCSPEAQGIVLPTPGATITQTNDGNYGPTYFEVVYCSGQYFETQSIDGSVWLTFPNALNSGQLLIKDQAPDNLDTSAGFYSYRFNASISPEDGDYTTGEMTLSVYETTTGYYNPMNFEITSENITFAVVSS